MGAITVAAAVLCLGLLGPAGAAAFATAGLFALDDGPHLSPHRSRSNTGLAPLVRGTYSGAADDP